MPDTTITIDELTPQVSVSEAGTQVNVTAEAAPTVMVWSDMGSGLGPIWQLPTPTDVARVLRVLENALEEGHLSPAMQIEWRYNRNQLIQRAQDTTLLFTNLGIERTRINRLSETSVELVAHVDLLDQVINVELAALHAANIDHNQTLFDHNVTLLSNTSRILQTESSILLQASQITSLDDGVTATDARLTLVADAINLTVSQNAIDADGRMSAAEAAINLNADNITLSVGREADTYQRHVETNARIDIQADSIISTVSQIEILQGDLVTTNSAIAQLDDAIALSVAREADTYQRHLDTNARIDITDANITDQVSQIITLQDEVMDAQGDIVSAATIIQKVVTTQVMFNDKWMVNIVEDTNGKSYATGFGLNLNTAWIIGKNYLAGERVLYNNKIWDCQAAHLSSEVYNPEVASPTYWLEDPAGVKSEFSIKADSFRLYSPLGNHVSPFSVIGDVIQINAAVTFATPLATQINAGVTTIDGGKITTGSLNASKIEANTITAAQIASALVTAGRIELQNNSGVTGAGIVGGGTAGTDIRFFAGATYANRNTAPFRVNHSGKMWATDGEFSGTITADTILANNLVLTGAIAANGVTETQSYSNYNVAPYTGTSGWVLVDIMFFTTVLTYGGILISFTGVTLGQVQIYFLRYRWNGASWVEGTTLRDSAVMYSTGQEVTVALEKTDLPATGNTYKYVLQGKFNSYGGIAGSIHRYNFSITNIKR